MGMQSSGAAAPTTAGQGDSTELARAGTQVLSAEGAHQQEPARGQQSEAQTGWRPMTHHETNTTRCIRSGLSSVGWGVLGVGPRCSTTELHSRPPPRLFKNTVDRHTTFIYSFLCSAED